MSREELQAAITAALSDRAEPRGDEPGTALITFDEGGQFLNGNVARENIVPVMKKLRDELGFNYLFCLTCVDWKTHFTMMYHLRNLDTRDELVIKSKIEDVNNPAIDTVSNLWQTANFHEREVYDLFGVKFYNHPDLRRIFLDEQWPGYPLRKNYEDPNMIEL
jgi:NADH:ubiquinone oxidoreductase subunit C